MSSTRRLAVKVAKTESETAHKPFIADHLRIPELTTLPLIVGCVLGIVFGASSLYLALKVGMTVSASIPIAVMSITIFRLFSKAFNVRRATILENNVVQTTGSAGESIAFGVAVTMPALMILGYNMELARVMLVALLGSILGILMMIPLRWALIVRAEKELVYPEGTACAEVLIVGEKGGTSARTVFIGFGIGFVYKLLNIGMKLWKDVPEYALAWYKNAVFATEVAPELLGVGYVIGPRIASIMVAGGVLSAFVLIPAITLFGSYQSTPLFPATKLIAEMKPYEIWRNYVLYIGAGAVAAGGIISMIRSLPVIARSLVAGLRNVRAAGVSVAGAVRRRTERDIPMRIVLGGVGLLTLAIWFAPTFHMNLLGAILIVLFGFLFVTVSSRITGEIGSSSNPISGMTVATLLLTCLIFVAVGWMGAGYRLTALSVAAIVCIAASNGGTTSQDLKTGFLVGATPMAQQIGIILGSVTSALVIGYTLLVLNNASTIYHKVDFPKFTVDVSAMTLKEHVGGPERAIDQKEYHVVQLPEAQGEVAAGKYLADDTGHLAYLVDPGINGTLKARDDGTTVTKYEAPKARLMALIIDGVMTQKLPWGLVLIGVFIAVLMELCGVASLPFAVGVYLPLSSSAPIFFGGMIRYFVERVTRRGQSDAEAEGSPGVLWSSGLIAGGAIAGILVALMSVKEQWGKALDLSQWFPGLAESDLFPYICFGALVVATFAVGRGWLLKDRTAN